MELSRVVVNKLQEWPYDYFDIRFQTIERFPDKPMKKSENRRYCHGYFNMEGSFSRLKKEIYNNSICPFFPERNQVGKPFSFSEDTAHYADEKNCRIYCVELRLGMIIQKNDGSKEFRLPAPVHDLYHFYYKFTPISNCEAIYPPPVRQLRKMHAGFLSWDINIMDDKPENYLNIDRDRLREGAVIEEEFTPIRKTILQHWCSHLISCRKKSLKQQAKGKVKGKEKNELLELISLTLLLYQNVSDKQFQEFIGLYGDIVNDGNLPRLAGEVFPVNRLWEKGAKFKFIVVTLSGWQELSHIFAGQGSEETDPPTLIANKDTISALPHRLIHIDKISLDEDGAENLAYYMHLGPQTSYPCKIEMDDAARLFDYSRAIGPGTGKIDFAPLVRKVFKPDKKYPHLLIPKYPKTFKRGDNFSSPLDHCIRWYIISPFDRGMTKQLRQFFEDPRYPGDIITRLKGHIKDYTKQSKQFDKCVKYVCKQHLVKEAAAEQLSPDESLEDVVRAEYQQFCYDCCKILIEYRGIIKNQSTRTDVAEEAEQSAEPLPAAGQPGVNEAPDPTQLDLNP